MLGQVLVRVGGVRTPLPVRTASAFHAQADPPTSATGSAPVSPTGSTQSCPLPAAACSPLPRIGDRVGGEAGPVPHAHHVPTVQEAAVVGLSPGVGLVLGGEAGVDDGDSLALAVLHHPEAHRGAQVALEGGLLQHVVLLACSKNRRTASF